MNQQDILSEGEAPKAEQQAYNSITCNCGMSEPSVLQYLLACREDEDRSQHPGELSAQCLMRYILILPNLQVCMWHLRNAGWCAWSLAWHAVHFVCDQVWVRYSQCGDKCGLSGSFPCCRTMLSALFWCQCCFWELPMLLQYSLLCEFPDSCRCWGVDLQS